MKSTGRHLHGRLDRAARRVNKRIRWLDRTTGKTIEWNESVRFYSLGEIKLLLAGVGLELSETYGDFDGRGLHTQAERMIVLATKVGT